MRRCLAALSLYVLVLITASSQAQTQKDRVDLYFGDWHSSPPRTLHGKLEVRDVLTRGDALAPKDKGAVLRYVNAYVYATLAPGASTSVDSLHGQQEIYYVTAGQGILHSGHRSMPLHAHIAALVPDGMSFSLENSGKEVLSLYLIQEPVAPGFRPNHEILLRDENQLPIATSSGMWNHIAKRLFVTSDGLATLEAVLTVTLDPLTLGKPHPVPNEDSDQIEEVWTALDGSSIAMVGYELRRQTPGMAYLHIPDNKTPHTNINASEDSQARFLYFARYRDHETRK